MFTDRLMDSIRFPSGSRTKNSGKLPYTSTGSNPRNSLPDAILFSKSILDQDVRIRSPSMPLGFHSTPSVKFEEIGLELLPKSIRGEAPSRPEMPIGSQSRQAGESLSELVERFERQVLEEELAKHGYNQTETAKALRMALSTLNQKVQRLGIDTKRRRRAAG